MNRSLKSNHSLGNGVAGLPPLADRQERRLVNPNQAGKGKAHPLALGSPSLTSIHNHSWDWNFSTYMGGTGLHHREGSTPGSSIRSPSTEPHHHYHHTSDSSPSESVHSLHHPPAGSGVGLPRTRSLTMPNDTPLRTSSISPNRMRRHSRAPSGMSGIGHSLDQSVAEADDEEVMTGIEAAMDKLKAFSDDPVMDSPSAEVDGSEEDVPQTPHIRPGNAPADTTPEEDAEALPFQQPPELSSSLSSSAHTSNSPDTPPSSLSRQSPLSRPATMTRSASHSPNHSRAASGAGNGPTPPPMLRSQTSAGQPPAGTDPAPTSTLGGKKGGIWNKMKAVTLSSNKSQNGSKANPAGGEQERKSSFTGGARTLLERTTSRGQGGTMRGFK